MTRKLRLGKAGRKAGSVKADLLDPRRIVAEPKRRAGRIEFDPLEPRVLMSADPLIVNLALLQATSQNHDVVLRVAEAATSTPASPARIVEIVDRANNNARLAFGDLTKVSSVQIVAGAGANTITVDAGKIGGKGLPSVDVQGGGASTALVIDDSSTPETWALKSLKSGVATGGVQVSFAGVDALSGSGSDILTGFAADLTWNVTGAGAGDVAGATTFRGFNALRGAAGNRDTFAFAPGGAMAGGVDGGDGGYDTLTLSGAHRTFQNIAMDAHSGTIVLDGAAIPYAGLEPISNTGTVTDVVFDLPASDLNDTVTLTGGGGQLTLTSGNGGFETTSFADPTGSLTIKMHSSGATVNVASLDPGFHAGLIIDSGDSVGVNGVFLAALDPGVTGAVNVNASVSTGGHDFKIVAGTITVAANVAISTQATGVDSGAIDMTGRNISLLAGSKLDASAAGALKAGAVTLTATYQDFRGIELPVDYSNKSVSVSLKGATIKGGDVKIEATASDVSAADEVPVQATGIVSTLTGLAQQLPNDLFSAATGIAASAVLRGANAAITVADTNIVSSGTVDIASDTAVQTVANAIDVKNNALGFGLAISYGQATSTVSAVLSGTSQISASKDVSVTAKGSVEVKSTARASANLLGDISATAQSYAIAVAYTNINATAETDANTKITAGGNVELIAKGTDSNTTSAGTAGFVDATAGNAVGIGVDLSKVHASLNGAVTAGGTVKGAPGPTFDATAAGAVDPVTNALYIPDHGLKTGDQIKYTAKTAAGAAATTVSGLDDDATYYVVALDKDHVQLAKARVVALDPSAADPHASQSLSIARSLAFNLDAIDAQGDAIAIAGSGFADGDNLVYNANGYTPITGLISGKTYKVHTVDDDHFQLIDPTTGVAAQIAQDSALGWQTFTDGGNEEGLNLATIDNSTHTLNIADHGLTAGETVNYTGLDGDGAGIVGGIKNATDYHVSVLSPNAIQLLDPGQNDAVAQITDPGASAQAFSFLGEKINFNPVSAVDGVSGNIALPGNDLYTGEAVLYLTDPTRSHTVSVPVADASNPGAAPLIVTAYDQEIGGLTQGETYYVVKIDADHIRLAATPNDALNAQPILLGAGANAGAGAKSQLATGEPTGGVDVKATLKATDKTSAKPEQGGKFNWSKFTNVASYSDISLFPFFGNNSANSGKTTIQDDKGKDIQKGVQNNKLSEAGSVAFIYADHQTHAFVGDLGATTVATPGDVTVASATTETWQEISQATVSKPSKSSGNAVAISIAFGYYSNDSEAEVFGTSTIDAGGAVDVNSTLTYPFVSDPKTFFTSIPSNLEKNGASAVSKYLDGTLGVASYLLNTWSVAGAKALEGSATSASGSIAINIFNNNNHATIDGGARINQNTAYQTATQSVSVDATTTIRMIDVAGIGKWSVNPFGFLGKWSPAKALGEAKGPLDQLKGGDIIQFGSLSGGKSLGGSILIDAITNNTVALVAAGAAVRIGVRGALSVDAEEDILRVDISQSGGVTEGRADNSLAFAGSGLGAGQNSTTVAGIAATDALGVNVTGGGKVDVTAHSGGTQVNIAGALVNGTDNATGVGVSVVVTDLIRLTTAYIGADPTSGTDPVAAAKATPISNSTLNAGDVTLHATLDGTVVDLAVAGSVSSAAKPSASPSNPVGGAKPQSAPGGAPDIPAESGGVGVAGSATVNVFNSKTLAYLNMDGAASVNTLAIDANDGQLVVNASGAVALTFNGGKPGTSVRQYTGAFAIDVDQTDTEAFLQGVVLTSNAAAVAGAFQVSLDAEQTTKYYSVSASIAGSSTQGANYAGSFSVNVILDTTQAFIDSANILKAGNVGVVAKDGVSLLAVGGGVAVSLGEKANGSGASIAYNQISATTGANVSGLSRRSAIAASSLSLDAEDDETIRAIAVSAGVAAGDQGDGKAFTLAINVISTDPKIFTGANGGAVSAGIANADVTLSGAATVLALDNAVIQSLAGALALGTTGSGIGASITWNQIDVNVKAEISGAALVTAGSVGVTAKSTQSNNLIDGKISAAAVGAAGAGDGNALAGALAINGVIENVSAAIDGGASVMAANAIDIEATDTSTIRSLTGGVAISTSGDGVGAALGGNYIDNSVNAIIDGATVSSTGAGAIIVHARESADIEAIAAGLAGAEQNAVGGSLVVSVITDKVKAAIDGAAIVTTGGAVSVTGENNASTTTVAGQIAVSGGDVGFGAALANADVIDTNDAFISGRAQVKGTTGVAINATTDYSHLTVIAIGGALAPSGVAIAGSATVTVVDDHTRAYIGDPGANPPAGAGVTAGTGAGSTGDVTITATDTLHLLGTAGALAFGGNVGVGAGVDVDVVTLDTEAYVGANAKASADGSVIVQASVEDTIYSFSLAGAGSSKVAVGLNAGVSVINLTTMAKIDSGATVFARDNLVVSAQDRTSVILASGNVEGAGTVAVGVAAGVATINKTTDASIAADAHVDALALGSATTALSGDFAPASAAPAVVTPDNVSFAASAASGDQIAAVGHGLNTGDEVVYSGAHGSLGGLDSGGVYYVIKIDADHFKLALSRADALAGNAIALSQGGAGAADSQQIQRIPSLAAPSVSASNFSGQISPTTQVGDPTMTSRSGVAVVAVSTNELVSAGFSGGGAGSVAVNAAGAVAVDTINTRAHIDAGAKVNQAAGADARQSVAVDAGRSYSDLTLGIGASFSGAVAVAPAIAVPILLGETSAKIVGPATSGDNTLVNARRDVEVAAHATASIVGVAAGVAISGTAGVAGSAAAVVINTTTAAEITGYAQVAAGGNVAVVATDVSSTYDIAGAVGLGFGGGGGAGSFAIALVTKDVHALIANHASVDADANGPNTINGVLTGAQTDAGFSTQAIRGVAVQAFSNETIVSVSGSGAGGLYVGIAGGVAVEETNVQTVAAIRNGASVNQNDAATANGLQSVAVGANDTLNITSVAGAVGIGIAGIGAGVDVEVLHDNAQAYIGGADVRAANAVDVDALTNEHVASYALAVGGGGFGLGGGISVLSIGGGLNSNYSANGDGGVNGGADALSDGHGGSLPGAADAALSAALTGLVQTGSGALPAFDPATAVDNSQHTINFGTADNLRTGDAVRYSANGGSPIGGLKDGQTYFVIVRDANTIQLAASRDDAFAGVAISISSLGASGAGHSLSAGGTDIQNSAAAQVTPTLPNDAVAAGTSNPLAGPIPGGTTAAIAAGSTVAARTVDLKANHLLNVTDIAGGGGVGLVAVGVGVAVVTVDTNVAAYVGADVTIHSLGGGVLAVDATRNSTINALGVAGTLSGFVSLGSAVASVTDTGATRAALGADVTDAKVIEPGSAAQRLTLDGAGFAAIEVKATDTVTVNEATGSANISGIAGLGAAISATDVEGTTQALIGDYALLGSTAAPVGAVDVEASRTVVIGPYNSGQPYAIGISGGLGLGGAAGVGIVTVGGVVDAEIGAGAAVVSNGALTLKAIEDATAAVLANGGGIGLIGIGAMVVNVTIGGAITAAVEEGAIVSAASVDIEAKETSNASATATPLGGGALGAGAGASTTVTIDPTTHANIADGAFIVAATGDVDIAAHAINNGTASSQGKSYAGGVTAGISNATLTITNVDTAVVGRAKIVAGGSFSLLADTSNTADAGAKASTGASINIARANSTLTINDTTQTSIGVGGTASLHADIGAQNRIDAEARMETTVTGDGAAADTGGLGVDARTDGEMNVTGATKTEIGTYATLQADAVAVLARVTKLDITSSARADAKALGATTNSTANLTTNSTASVVIDANAVVVGFSRLDVKARQESVATAAYAESSTSGLGGNTSPTSNTNLTLKSFVTADAAAEADSHVLNVEAYADTAPGYAATTSRTAAPIDTGSANSTQAIVYDREIHWNGKVQILPAPDPTLIVDAAGNFVRQINISAHKTAAGIVVDDIFNTAAISGSASFIIAGSYLDNNPTDAGTVTATALIDGAPSIVYLADFRRIEIDNSSGLTLTINNINPASAATSFVSNVVVSVPNHAAFTPSITSRPGDTTIVIDNHNAAGNAGGNIVLNGVIANAVGASSTSIHADLGAIVIGSAAQNIATNTLILGAGGAIGAAGAPLAAASTLLVAQAGGDIYVNAAGTLNLGGVASTSGVVNLNAAGAIVDGLGGGGVDVTGATITLRANGGAIGSSASPLVIAALGASAHLDATAKSGVWIVDRSGALVVGAITAATGDVSLQTIDRVNAGQDISLSATSSISTGGGGIALTAGDNVFAAAGSAITATGAILISGNVGEAETVPTGAIIDLRGAIVGAGATISGSAEADVIGLARVGDATPTLVVAGATDIVLIGSNENASAATPTNSGGALSGVQGALTIQGGGFVQLDDSGDVYKTSGALDATKLTGFGMIGSIAYAQVTTLAIALGSADDGLAVLATSAVTTTAIKLGAGSSTVVVGGADNTTHAIAGALQITGGTGASTLEILDFGAPGGETGRITQSRITGLGMGDPTTGGVTYSAIANLLVRTGSGADAIVIDGSSANTLVVTGGGGDVVTAGPDLASFVAPVEVRLGGGGHFNVESNASAGLTLGADATGLGTVAFSGATARIAFGGANLLNVNLNGGGDFVAVQGTVAPTTINLNGGNDRVTISGAQNSTTVNLGGGTNKVTVTGASAAVNIVGWAGGVDTLDLDLSATTDAVVAGRIFDAGLSAGVLRGFLAADVFFSTLSTLNVKLGSGNDFVTVNDSLAATTINLDGGAGDDAFRFVAIGAGAAHTTVAGGAGTNIATVAISGFPQPRQFANLDLNGRIDTLIVDNLGNVTGVAWTEIDGQTLSANYSDPALAAANPTFLVINTASAGSVTILGGDGANTLTDVTTTTAGISGTIDGDNVVLRSGLKVLSPITANTFQYFPGAMSFDGLVTGQASYAEAGFRLAANKAAGGASAFVVSTSVSDAAQAFSATDTFTLTAADGGAFSLYALSFADTAATPQTIVLTGVTLNGKTITKTIVVSGGAFSQFSLPSTDGFIDVASVSWTANNTVVDNIEAVETFASAAAAATPGPINAYAITGNVTFNTSGNTLLSGSIQVTLGDGTIATINPGDTLTGAGRFGVSVTDVNGTARFTFAGDLTVGANVTITAAGARGLSLYVTNNVTVASTATFDLAGHSQNAGAGAGSGGGAGYSGRRGYGGGGGYSHSANGNAYGAGGGGGGGGDLDSSGGSGGGGLNGGNGYNASSGSHGGGGGAGGGVSYNNTGAGGGGGAYGAAGTRHRTFYGYAYFGVFKFPLYHFYGYGGWSAACAMFTAWHC